MKSLGGLTLGPKLIGRASTGFGGFDLMLSLVRRRVGAGDDVFDDEAAKGAAEKVTGETG
jgi:hypothetical protein